MERFNKWMWGPSHRRDQYHRNPGPPPQGRRQNKSQHANPAPRPSRSPSPPKKTSLELLMEKLALEPGDKVINVLLLGETGVGKSTFINSLANYLEFQIQNFEEAETESLQVIIPTSFTAYDKDNTPHLLEVGKNHKNENTSEVGESSTQKIRTYKFGFSCGLSLSIIDTPGMGDTRGIQQDEENCEYILKYISQLKSLHAICYLFRPEESRATAHFRYCMTQILSRLEKSACDNIAFVFTNSKNFTPGETYSVLKKLSEDIKKHPPYVSIPVEHNKFCFDNEPFKYLAAVQRGVQYDDAHRKAMKKTWKKSSAECYKLIEYILKLKPHNVRNTAAINECRRIIFQLSQPMADIAQNIDDNLYMLERHEADMNIDKNSLEELKDKLFIPIVDLEVKELRQPVTVCSDSKCADVVMVGERTKWHYKTRCHNPCYLDNVPKDIIGDPALASCAAITGPGQTCSNCGCHYKVHMHVYYQSETVNKQQVDEVMSQNVKSKEEILEKARKVIQNIKNERKQHQAELDMIIQYNAKFAHFVQNNAITPINDCYEDYINHLIKAENRVDANKDSRKLDGLKQLLREHIQVKETLKKAEEYQKKMGHSFQAVSPNDIQNCIGELFKLKLNGKKIKQMYDAQKQSRNNEYLDSEYVHHNTFDGKQRTLNKKNNNKKGKGKNNNYNTSSYSQATKGYPEVPKHEIESEDSDSDEDKKEYLSAENNDRFPDRYEQGYPERELREYPDDRFGRMGYRGMEDNYYPQRGFYRDIPEAWGRYDYPYYPRDPRFYNMPPYDMPPRDVPPRDAPFEGRKQEGPFNYPMQTPCEMDTTGDAPPTQDGVPPSNAPRDYYNFPPPPRGYGPPPGWFRYSPERWYYDERRGQFPGIPHRESDFPEHPDVGRTGKQEFGVPSSRESMGPQGLDPRDPRGYPGKPDNNEVPAGPREAFGPQPTYRDPRAYPYRGEYPPSFYRDEMRFRGYPEYPGKWDMPPRDPYGYPSRYYPDPANCPPPPYYGVPAQPQNTTTTNNKVADPAAANNVADPKNTPSPTKTDTTKNTASSTASSAQSKVATLPNKTGDDNDTKPITPNTDAAAVEEETSFVVLPFHY